MREIKYKAYIKSLKWIVPVERINFDVRTVEVDLSSGNGDTCDYDFDEVELMQFTGLKDKNGKEIYEGDVTKHHSHNTISKWIYSSRYLQFMSLESDGTHRYYFDIDKDKLEVIGNIYQNPELMEVE